jgi:AraC-like DNA-binding protein
MTKTNPTIEYLHHQIIRSTGAGKLQRDALVIELVMMVVNSITQTPDIDTINATTKKFHLITIEKAKEYINQNFYNDISLFDIASFACVSPFHFSRVFKKFTNFSPYQYLHNVRLKHSEMQLKITLTPIADVSFNSGFATPEYFATSFKQKYGMTPSDFREKAYKNV